MVFSASRKRPWGPGGSLRKNPAGEWPASSRRGESGGDAGAIQSKGESGS